ncbi:MAG TPA: 1-deoxy-D-xylulose-5-phosphate reductoisomerase, partial [Paracoccaceae bacterium]|nr:1-deoxy-D-xylulose-5-phosphate reductoisomerase [Paracoccaceae bacterium]
MTRKISILGSTGSIGCNTVDLIQRLPEGAVGVEALTGSANVTLLAKQAKALRAKVAVTANPDFYEPLKQALAGSGIEAAAGVHALIEAAARPVD